MHIKDSPVKGYKADFAGFELDASKIELHSAHKREIHLPYSGPLPDALQDNDGAVISIMPTVNLRISVSLTVTKGKAKTRYRIAATPQEINDILFRFFFVDKGDNSCPTNWDCGLNHYWIGHYKSSYTHWKRFVVEGHGMMELVDQLSPDALGRLERHIADKKAA